MTDQQSAEGRVGTVLHGKWKLERLLGVGGMAAVYEATHRIGRRDAIKILHPAVARSADLRERFEQEAHAVNRFTHPGAVEIRDVDVTEDGAPFLVMELLDGEPLSQHVGRPGGLSLDELLRYADELLDVLAAAHGQGIIHRDIKPDNLFVLKDGRLKVLDFGIARMRESSAKSSHTLLGTRLGTLPYMPPEQIKGLPIDGRADLFAVGAMLFRLITGRRVHEAPTEADLATRMLTEPAPPLGSVSPATPEPVCMVVDRALAFDRQRRYPDARSMQEDVRAARAGTPPPCAARMLRESGPPNPSPRAPSKTPLMAGGSAAGASLADAPTDAAAPLGMQLEPTGATAAPAREPTGVTAAPGAAPASEPTSVTAAASPSAMASTRPAQPVTMVSPGAAPPNGLEPPTALVPGAPLPAAVVGAVTAVEPGSSVAYRAADEERRKRLLAVVLTAAGIGLALLLLFGWWWAASREPTESGSAADHPAAGGADAAAGPSAPEPGPSAAPSAITPAPGGTKTSTDSHPPSQPPTSTPGTKTPQPTTSSATPPTTSPPTSPTPAPTPLPATTTDTSKKDKNKGHGKGKGHG
jgi:eukaryotic-like serine/threonine-protein kinase